MSGAVLAIDQGTTSTRSFVFDSGRRILGSAQQAFAQHYPYPGWVEHDPEDLWRTTLETMRAALDRAGLAASALAGIGITNQRETTLVWDRRTGQPVGRAIVWQDRRTADLCQSLKADGAEPALSDRTGLLLDPYFSGTKIRWLLDNIEGARAGAERGDLLFGTVDAWLIWRLTGGRVHRTDATNASRTLLFDIRAGAWSDDMLRLLGVPRAMLPEVMDCAAGYGMVDPAVLGAAIPILGVAGDQHAAMLGQACFAPGMVKATYGTGCFAILNIGPDFVPSANRLLTTIAYRLDGRTTYGLEGSIFIAGAAVQWLRDSMKLVANAAETGALAADADPDQAVYLVPAFTGLGAPHWDPHARGAIYGITRNTGPKEFARAALEAVCFQTADLLGAMHADWQGSTDTVLRVDGGMVASDWTMQRLADILAAPVDRPTMLEASVLGAAWLAGREAGIWPDMAEFAAGWQRERRFEPRLPPGERARQIAGWTDAVRRTRSVPG